MDIVDLEGHQIRPGFAENHSVLHLAGKGNHRVERDSRSNDPFS